MTKTIYDAPQLRVLLIQQQAIVCQSYNVNSLNNYNQRTFNDDDWD